MKVKWFTHLPGVVLDGCDKVPIGHGVLMQIPFEDWSKLDAAFSRNERDYNRTRPIFYIGEANLLGNLKSIIVSVNELVRLLYLAFLLDESTPLIPHPYMSVNYIQVENSIFSLIGPFEREWILFGGKIGISFDEARLSRVQWAHDILSTLDSNNTFRGIEGGLLTLELTSRPEFWWDEKVLNRINDFIHCMTALENILLPSKEEAPKKMLLTPTFGKYAAVFINPSRSDLHERSKSYSGLYKLRSRLIHGEIGISDLKDEELTQLISGRRLLRHVIIHSLILKQIISTEQSLPHLLARAYEDPNFHQSLFEKLQRSKFYVNK